MYFDLRKISWDARVLKGKIEGALTARLLNESDAAEFVMALSASRIDGYKFGNSVMIEGDDLQNLLRDPQVRQDIETKLSVTLEKPETPPKPGYEYKPDWNGGGSGGGSNTKRFR